MNNNKLDVYDSEKEEVLKNQIKYALPVRIGNWNNDLYVREEEEKLMKRKKDNCQLLIQKMGTIYTNLLKPLKPQREIEYVNYGELYHIKATDVPDRMKPCPNKRSSGLYLCGLMNENDITYGDHFMHGCAITASPDKQDYVRNLFVFVSTDINRDGTSVNYGEDVYIRISETGSNDMPLYIQCEQANVETFGSYLHVRLTKSLDMYCRFKILHWNPEYRQQTRGVGVPPRARIIINHVATGELLAVNCRHWLSTFFGPECSVICHTFKDGHKMETAENMFSIVGMRILNKNMIVRAAKGEDVGNDLIE